MQPLQGQEWETGLRTTSLMIEIYKFEFDVKMKIKLTVQLNINALFLATNRGFDMNIVLQVVDCELCNIYTGFPFFFKISQKLHRR